MYYKSMGASETQGVARLDPRGLIVNHVALTIWVRSFSLVHVSSFKLTTNLFNILSG